MKHNYKKFIFFIILLVILKIFFTIKCENIEIYKFEKTKKSHYFTYSWNTW